VAKQEKRVSLAAVDKRGAIATITINRPDQHNALDLATSRALEAAAHDVETDKDILVVILCGAGRAFCGGGDIFAFAEHLDGLEAYAREALEVQHRFILSLARMPKITLAAVHGSAAGAGLSIAAMCDMCVAEEDARFVPAFASLGLSPDSGGSFGLARAVGARRALQLFLAKRSFSAAEAEAWGLVTSIANRGEVMAVAKNLALDLVAIGSEAIAGTKKLIGDLDAQELEVQLRSELEGIIRCMRTQAFGEAVRSFTNKK
jgi:enoyl-CoA hydratase/carnithine racemase